MNERIEKRARNKKAVLCPKCRGIMESNEISSTGRGADARYQCGGCGYDNDLGLIWRYSN